MGAPPGGAPRLVDHDDPHHLDYSRIARGIAAAATVMTGVAAVSGIALSLSDHWTSGQGEGMIKAAGFFAAVGNSAHLADRILSRDDHELTLRDLADGAGAISGLLATASAFATPSAYGPHFGSWRLAETAGSFSLLEGSLLAADRLRHPGGEAHDASLGGLAGFAAGITQPCVGIAPAIVEIAELARTLYHNNIHFSQPTQSVVA